MRTRVSLETGAVKSFSNIHRLTPFQTTTSQGARVFVTSPDGRIFVLFAKGIAQLNPKTYEITMLAETPVTISPGGAWLDGRIYFGHKSHLYSWHVPPME
ncbi:MAG: hypothetical protein KAI66_15410 [Lentisphaeria bacterium]|nr:hypothetical protein [Lentisphaeria bacterium]